jgi:DNA-damage-inducible protein D
MSEMSSHPLYRSTMDQLEALKRVNNQGIEYWRAREIHPVLGYPIWRNFEPVIQRAKEALAGNDIDPSNHFAETRKMVDLGSGSQREVGDILLSRGACYLVAMNGEPNKPQIAAAQAYFVIQTRRQETAPELSDDEKRVQLRDKVKQSFKRVSGAAQEAGVRSHMQGVFHDARYQGLYGMSLKELRQFKGLAESEQLFDRAGPLELSANDFQMNLAADVISKDEIRGEQRSIQINRALAHRVRNTISESRATMPEHLPLEPPIKEVQKRLRTGKKLPPTGTST